MSGKGNTRERIVETSAELFRTQGYNATGVKQIVTAAQAPFGSIYHFFPGGKEQLGAEAIIVSGALYVELIPAVLEPAPDPVTGVRNFFAGAAEHLHDTDYADACPPAGRRPTGERGHPRPPAPWPARVAARCPARASP